MFFTLTLLCLIPIAAYWLARWFFYRNTIDGIGGHDCRITTNELATKLSFTGKIPRPLQEKRQASALAEILFSHAYLTLAAQHPGPIAMRRRADNFAIAIPAFSLMIGIFAICVAKNVSITLFCVALVNAIAFTMKFTSRTVASHAAEVAIDALRKARIPRQSDEESIETCIKALTWK